MGASARAAKGVVGGGLLDAIAAALGGAADSPLTTMLGPLGMLRTAAALAQGSPNVTPAPVMPMTAAAQRLSNRIAPPPTSTGGKVARFVTSMAVPLPGPAKEEAVANAVEQAVPKIVAYHGSPHTFDAFDASKIGTGEGAQVYGHGLYFAENPEVAQGYRDKLGVPPHYASPDALAQRVLDATNGDRDAAVGELKNRLNGWLNLDPANRTDDGYDHFMGAIQAVQSQKPLGTGATYHVGINAHPDHFLDWDKPLSEQHPTVQGALGRLGVGALRFGEPQPSSYSTLHPIIGPRGNQVAVVGEMDGRFNLYQDGEDLGQFPSRDDALKSAADAYGPIPGAAAYHGLAAAKQSELDNPLRGLSRTLGSVDRSTPDQLAAQALSDAGIPGIKYLDAGSRSAGDGTRNYVVFDPKNIDILKRYGIAATALGGAGAAAATAGTPDSAQAQPADDLQPPPRGIMGASAR